MPYPAAPADVGGNVLAKCEAAMMVRLLMSQDRELLLLVVLGLDGEAHPCRG